MKKSRVTLTAEERASLLPLLLRRSWPPGVESRRVDSLSLVRFDANQYSVPTEFARRPVRVIASVETVRVV